MTDCTTLDRQLDDYLAGRLAEEDAVALESHAGGCDRCAALLEPLTRLDVTLPLELTPPPELRSAVLAVVAPRSRRFRWLIPPAIAAALLLAFAIATPTPKSALAPPEPDRSAQLAARRADREFRQLAVARREVEAALASSPASGELRDALARLDAQRRALENLVREFDS